MGPGVRYAQDMIAAGLYFGTGRELVGTLGAVPDISGLTPKASVN